MKNVIGFILLLISFGNVAANHSFKIAIIHNTPDQLVAARILETIYREIGIGTEFIPLPGKRALLESSSGRIDGEAQRIHEIGLLYPDLIRVPTSYISWDSAVFTKNKEFSLVDWSSLKAQKVSRVRGMRYAEVGLMKAGVKNVLIVSDVNESMSMLNSDMVDFAISSRFNGMVLLNKEKLPAIHALPPSLTEWSLYHYVHKKHKKLVPKLDEMIKKMKKSGELSRLKHEYSLVILNQ